MKKYKLYVCAVCGRRFLRKAPNVRYCGPICKQVGESRRHEQWLENHPNYHRDYMRARRAKEKKELTEGSEN